MHTEFLFFQIRGRWEGIESRTEEEKLALERKKTFRFS